VHKGRAKGNSKVKIKALYAALLATFLFLSGSINAWAVPVVAAGYDFFSTQSPSSFMGVAMEGNQFNAFDFGEGMVDTGNADTIVHRLSDAECTPDAPPFPCTSETIDIEMIALSMKTVSQVDLGLGLDDYYVVLNSGTQSFGEMTISFDSEFGGTFTSIWDNIDIEVRKGSTTGAIALSLSLTGLTNTGSAWGREHVLGATLLDGLNHELNDTDHMEDFWPIMPVASSVPGAPNQCIVHMSESVPASHCTRYSVNFVPIPSAVWLFGSALAGLGWVRRKQTS
jgi:hypothetical protein